VKKRSVEDVVVAAPDVLVAPALADCGPNMLDDGYFDDDDVATDNDEEAKWLDDGDVIPGVKSARQATEESNFESDNDDDNDDDDVLFSKSQLLDENADFNLIVEDDDETILPKVSTHETRVRSMLAAASAPPMPVPRRQEIITAPTLASSGHLRGLSNEERAMRMLKARENEKFEGISIEKLKKVRKATDLTVKHDQKKDNTVNRLFEIIAESKDHADLAEWLDTGNPLSPKERAFIVRLRGAPSPAKKLMLHEVMFIFAVNYKMDDSALDRSNSANSKKPRDQRTSWDYEYEPSSCKTAIGTLFGYFKQNGIEYSSNEFRESKYI
jgi:hypothetical protein